MCGWKGIKCLAGLSLGPSRGLGVVSGVFAGFFFYVEGND